MKSTEILPRSACVVLLSPFGHVLAVSRTKAAPAGTTEEDHKDYPHLVRKGKGGALVVPDFTRWGLPGGKAEANEPTSDTARRECFEEAGIVPGSLAHVLTRVANGSLCTTYTGRVLAEGSCSSEYYEGEAAWVHPCVVCHGGPFDEYNQFLFGTLNVDWSIPHRAIDEGHEPKDLGIPNRWYDAFCEANGFPPR